MNIFLRELKASLKSLIVWAAIVMAFILMGTGKFSAFYGNREMNAILEAMPPAILDAFSLRNFDLTTLSGFFGLVYTYFALLLGIAAAMWGSEIISKEERDKTAEFSLTLPVTRGRVVAAKTLSALADCAILLLVTWGASLAGARPFGPDAGFRHYLALLMLALFVLQMVFLSAGVFLGCALRRGRLAGPASVSLLLAAYFLSIISALDKDLDFLKYFTPFRYFDALAILKTSRFDMTFVLLSAAIIVAGMSGAYLAYVRRDLYI